MQQKRRLLKLFGIPSDEIIFEDFSCSIREGISKQGRIFITENYLCFYSTVLGLKTKKVIRIAEITDIKKDTSTLGLRSDVIEIITSNKQVHSFASFKKRDAAYSLMYGIWKGEPVTSFGGSEVGSDEDSNASVSDLSSESIVVEQSDVEILNTDKTEENQEMLRCILPISVDAFFEKFLSDKAIFSYGHHMEKQGSTDIKISEWKFNEELNCQTRECNLVIKLTGVPLRDKSRLQKIQTSKKEGESLLVSSTTKVFDVPYSGYFSTEERWEISPVEGSPEKSMLVCKGWVSFNKHTMMKKMITQRNEQGLKEDYDVWIASIRKILSAQKRPEEPQAEKQTHQLEQVLTKHQLKNEKPKKTKQQNSPESKRSMKLSSFIGPGTVKYLVGHKKQLVVPVIGALLILILLLCFILLIRIGTLETKIDDLTSQLLKLSTTHQESSNPQQDL